MALDISVPVSALTYNGTPMELAGIIPSGKITITENGTDIDVSQYATADVSVSGDVSDFIVRKTVTTVGNFGYRDIPALVGKLKYKNGIILIMARGTNVDVSFTNFFAYSLIHHTGRTFNKSNQWFGKTASYNPTQIVENSNVQLQSLDDLSINSDGSLTAGTSTRYFCGANCDVFYFEIPIKIDGTFDLTEW